MEVIVISIHALKIFAKTIVKRAFKMIKSSVETRKCNKCDYVINIQWAPNRCPGCDTGRLGIPGHGVGVREVRRSNPGGTTYFFSPYFAGNKKVLGLKQSTKSQAYLCS